jgi:hypothetical protein
LNSKENKITQGGKKIPLDPPKAKIGKEEIRIILSYYTK